MTSGPSSHEPRAAARPPAPGPTLVSTPVGAVPADPSRRGRCSALPDGRLFAMIVSQTEVAFWTSPGGTATGDVVVRDVTLGGEALRDAPPPTAASDVVCLCVPALGSRPPLRCVAVGFDTGELRIFAADGAFLFATRAHGTAVRRLRARRDCELTALHDNAVVLLDGGALRGVLYSCAREAAAATAASPWGPASTMPAAERVRWALPSIGGAHALGALADAVCCGPPPAGPFEATSGLGESHCLVLAGGVGGQACLQTVLASDDDGGASVAELARGAASALFSSVSSSLSRGLFWGHGGAEATAPSAEEEAAARRAREAALAAPPPRALAPIRSFSDPPRAARAVSVHPSGAWGAVADSLGRVALVELPSLIVRRTWRGYRDAQCAWLVAPHAYGAGSSVHLLLYAPLRGLLELWPLPCGPRAAVLAVGTGGMLGGGCATQTPFGDEADVCVFRADDGGLRRIAIDWGATTLERGGGQASSA